jgi:hypothetical protein
MINVSHFGWIENRRYDSDLPLSVEADVQFYIFELEGTSE